MNKIYLRFWYGHFISLQDRIKLLDFPTVNMLFLLTTKNVLSEGEKEIVEKCYCQVVVKSNLD